MLRVLLKCLDSKQKIFKDKYCSRNIFSFPSSQVGSVVKKNSIISTHQNFRIITPYNDYTDII